MNMFEICKLNQKHFRILYSKEQQDFIDNMPKLNGSEWDKKRKLDYSIWNWGDGTKIDNLIDYIKEVLEKTQGLYCAYCGMRLKQTSNAQIEHIAPKGNGRYSHFMFYSSNLTLACSLCNGFEKKEKKEHFNTIGKLEPKYEDCYFNIVHPYLDNPEDHFDLGDPLNKRITISSKTLKGQKSITVFALDEEPQTNGRWHHYIEHKYDFDPKFRQAFEKSCDKKGF